MTKGRVTAAVAVSSAIAVVLVSGLPASAASTSPSSPHAAARAPEPAPPRAAEPESSSRNVVARARMLECGHQWNSQKKNGTASGTWKDFSRACLAQR